ncbi:hypothetical protein SKAU_G00324040 [Synaphobranchus kaupii]|uniref:Uncharacterized protein n=1 Tax=Synaphobranchus kaupii TaxID=118154 RepID=A0A9Q1EP95_SYNKA|nr:hypothetical protein SKAU_G00324040 [Synaphobranchus kaupii]
MSARLSASVFRPQGGSLFCHGNNFRSYGRGLLRLWQDHFSTWNNLNDRTSSGADLLSSWTDAAPKWNDLPPLRNDRPSTRKDLTKVEPRQRRQAAG